MAAKAAKLPFLIDSPKRLKIAVNRRKQRVEGISGDNILDTQAHFC